jgi:basic membrane protein A and related proteins
MMKHQSFLLIVVLLTNLLLVACQPSIEPVSPVDDGEERPFRIGLILATGGLGDKSFNDSGYMGVEMARDQLGIEFDYVEPSEIAEYESHERSLAQTGQYDLIVGLGFDQADPMRIVAADFPGQKWLLIDGVIDGMENVRSITFKDHEKTFLIGGFGAQLSAGMLERGNDDCILGGVGGMDIPLIRAFAAGYMAGAKYINPECRVIINYVGGWADPATAKEIALSMYAQNADIVYQFAGGSGLGVFEAAKDINLYAFGTDVNQNWLEPDHIILSAKRFLDVAIFNTIADLIDGKWEPGHHRVGLADGAVGYTLEDSNINVPQDVIDIVEEMRERVVSGEFVIPDDLDKVDSFLESIER